MPHAYATPADLRTHRSEDDLRQLSAPEMNGVDDARLERALEAATAEIDGWVSGRYPTPLDPIAADELSCRLTIPLLCVATDNSWSNWCATLSITPSNTAILKPM